MPLGLRARSVCARAACPRHAARPFVAVQLARLNVLLRTRARRS